MVGAGARTAGTAPAGLDQLIDGLNPEQLRAVTHPGGPLLVVAGAGVPPDGCEGFGERAADSGALGRLRGVDILPGVVPLLA